MFQVEGYGHGHGHGAGAGAWAGAVVHLCRVLDRPLAIFPLLDLPQEAAKLTKM